MNVRPLINVTCAIIVDNDKVLVAQRSEKMSLPLKWEFPGGKIENNESAEDCIQRELHEELNISVRILEKLKNYPYDYEHVTVNLIPFVVKYVSGIITTAEHKAAIWLKTDELATLDWAAADIPILNDFLKNRNA